MPYRRALDKLQNQVSLLEKTIASRYTSHSVQCPIYPEFVGEHPASDEPRHSASHRSLDDQPQVVALEKKRLSLIATAEEISPVGDTGSTPAAGSWGYRQSGQTSSAGTPLPNGIARFVEKLACLQERLATFQACWRYEDLAGDKVRPDRHAYIFRYR